MRIRVANLLTTALVLALTGSTAFTLFRYSQIRAQESDAFRRQLEATRQVARFLAGSKQLTSSVQSYAATGDPRFARAYWRELDVNRSRDLAAMALRQLGLSEEEEQRIIEARANSDALVGREEQSLAAAARGDRATAISLVFGPVYQRALRSIYEPSLRMQQGLERRLAAERERVERQARRLWHLCLVLLLLNLFVVIGLLVWLYPGFVALPLLRLHDRVQALLRGEPAPPLRLGPAATEIRELAASLDEYHRIGEQRALDQWAKSQQVGILAALQRRQGAAAQALCFLEALAPLLELGAATFYGFDPEARVLRLLASYALNDPGAVPAAVPLGEGLLGQCALERQVVRLEPPPPDYLRIGSALGHAPAGSLLLLPVLAGERLLAVVELATLHPPPPHLRGLMLDLLPLLALVLDLPHAPAAAAPLPVPVP